MTEPIASPTQSSPGTTASRFLEWGSAYLSPDRYAEAASYGRWERYHWLRHLGAAVARCIERPRGRLLVNAPPRTGKSRLICHWTPTWFLDLFPDRRIMLAMYGQDVAEDWGRAVRDELNYNAFCQTNMSQDSKSAGRWHTRDGGGMLAVGVGGPVTGRGGDVLIVDDPIKNRREAESPTVRRQLREWFDSTFYTRAEPGASIIVCMARWHEEDLAGHLENEHEDDWEVVKLPMIHEKGVCPVGRSAGEALCPERYDADACASIEAAVTRETWASLYQQKPLPVGAGRLYKTYDPANNRSERVQLIRALPLHLSLDFNITPGMHGLLGQYDDRGSIDIFTAVHEFHGHRMDVEHLMSAFKAWVAAAGGWQWPELHVFGDASGSQEWAGTSESCYQIVFRSLAAMKIPYRRRVPRANPGVKDSIDAFNDALLDPAGQVHYVHHPRCVRLGVDLAKLRSDEDGLIDKSERTLSHSSDAERYRVHYLRPLAARIDLQGGRFGVTV